MTVTASQYCVQLLLLLNFVVTAYEHSKMTQPLNFLQRNNNVVHTSSIHNTKSRQMNEENFDNDNDQDNQHDYGYDYYVVPLHDRCSPIGECMLCPGAGIRAKKNHVREGCEMTQRRQKFECIIGGANAKGLSINRSRYTVFQNCKRTTSDEEYLMLELQVVCTIVAFFSISKVKKEKIVSASLFDQRRRKNHVQSEEIATLISSPHDEGDCIESQQSMSMNEKEITLDA